MPAPSLTGGCLCGGVRYEIAEPPVSASYCHCTRCQRRTGTAASAQARVAPGSFRIVAGAELVARVGAEPTRAGRSASARSAAARSGAGTRPTPDVISVRLGTFDAEPGIRPQWRQFVAYAAAWEPIPDDGLPRYEERPAG